MFLKLYSVLFPSFLLFGLFINVVHSVKVRTPNAIYVGKRVSLEAFKPIRETSSVDQFIGL